MTKPRVSEEMLQSIEDVLAGEGGIIGSQLILGDLIHDIREWQGELKMERARLRGATRMNDLYLNELALAAIQFSRLSATAADYALSIRALLPDEVPRLQPPETEEEAREQIQTLMRRNRRALEGLDD